MAKKVAIPSRAIPFPVRIQPVTVVGKRQAAVAVAPVPAPAPAVPARRRSGPPAPVTPAGKVDDLKATLESISPGLYSVHNHLSDLISKRIKSDIQWNFTFARKVKDAIDKHKEKGITALSNSLGVSKDFLSGAAQVAARYTEEDLMALLALAPSNGRPLSWSHIVELARIEDQADRDKLTAVVVEEGLTVEALKARTLKTFGAKSQGGRGFAMPKGLENTVSGLETFSGKFIRYADTWSDHFKKLVDETPVEKIKPATFDQMRKTSDELQKVAEGAEQQATAIDHAIARLRRKIEAAKPYTEEDAVAAFNAEHPDTDTIGSRIRSARALAAPAPVAAEE